MRTWVSPSGELHDVADEELHTFCSARGLHYSNMKDHIASESSDQKNDGWRLIERLRCIGHVDRPREHVLALGTLESFHRDCLASKDGRNVLKNRDNLGRLLRNRYNGGKPWNKWECRHLSLAEKRRLLSERRGLDQLHGAVAESSLSISLPDYSTNALSTPCANSAPMRVEDDSSATSGSQQVSF